MYLPKIASTHTKFPTRAPTYNMFPVCPTANQFVETIVFVYIS